MAILLANGDALHIPLADGSVHCVVTSPPYYGLRDYGIGGQIGVEETPEAYIANLVAVFREVWRVLREDGTVWLNLGDSYAGSGGAGEWSKRKAGKQEYAGPRGNNANRIVRSKRNAKRWGGGNLPATGGLKPKDLIGIPWRVAFALQADGWYLRSDIIWNKSNPMPESVADRPTKAHEYIFLLSKSGKYYYDAGAILEPASGWNGSTFDGPRDMAVRPNTGRGERNIASTTRNRRSVWTVATAPYSGAHFATYPVALVEPCIKAGTSEKGCCPLCGAPWERVVVRSGGTIGKGSWVDHSLDAEQGKTRHTGSLAGNASCDGSYRVETVGWEPTCEHEAEPVSCVVLDPFSGAGTTALVARKYGRHAVGLDLSLTYIRECAWPRLQMGALAEFEQGKKGGENHADLPLFADVGL